MNSKRRLYMPCVGYVEKGNNCSSQPLYWICSSHKDYVYITVSGDLVCENQYCYGYWADWGFSCHHHPGEYKKISSDPEFRKKLITALHCFMLGLYDNDEDFDFLKTLRKYVK